MNVSGDIVNNMKQYVKNGWLNYVTRFYLGSLKVAIVVKETYHLEAAAIAGHPTARFYLW